jgi:hypothetical protein
MAIGDSRNRRWFAIIDRAFDQPNQQERPMIEIPKPINRFAEKIPALLTTVLLGLLSLPADAAPKTDIIIFKNGDKLTGELKSLKRGELNFNTDATGTISIEWDKIGQIESLQNVQVETSSGTRFFGHLELGEEPGMVVVNTGNGLQEIEGERVILMTPIEDQGIGAFDIDLTVGYNFAKAGGVTQANLGIDVDYRTLVRIYSLTASKTVNDSDTQELSERANLGLQYKRLWSNRWYVNGNLVLDQNDELGLNLRTSLGGGGGRYLIQSNSMLLGLEGGLQVSNENLVSEAEDTDSIEAVFSVDWDWFLFDSPELDWSTSLDVIPSLTESGRVRANFDSRLQWEVINDLKWGISFYSTFDNKPQTDDASTSDYGVNTTLTYEF